MWPFSNDKPPLPPTVPTDQIVPVHVFDDVSRFRKLLIRQLLRFDEVLDVGKLHSSLFRLIDKPGWRRLGARIRLNADGKLEHHIPTAFNDQRPPVLFTHDSHGTRLGDHSLASQLPEPTTVPAVLGDVTKLDQLMRGLKAPKTFSEYLHRDIPQIAVHIESFDDATLISVSWTHILTDVLGMAFVLQAWQAVLDGREEDVPVINGPEIDLLDSAGRIPIERHYMSSSYMLKPWQMVLYVLNLLASRLWWGADEWKIIYIPGPWVHKVHGQASEDLKRGRTGHVLSRNDVLCAVLSRIASQGCWTREQPVLMFQSTNVRERLHSVKFPAGTATVGNFTNGTMTDMSARRVAEGPLWEVAASLRRTTEAHSRGDQMDAMTSIWRHGLETGNPLIIGRWTMHLVTFSNWTKGTSFQLDFAAARTSPTATTKPLHPSMGLPYLAMEANFAAMPKFWLMGSDESGGYWVTGSLSKDRWAQAAEVFAGVTPG